jgi:carbamate kinase
MYRPGAARELIGVEAVIDKDLCTELLARELDADFLIMATDVDAVYVDWGKPTAKALHKAHPDALAAYDFPAGSMGPKVSAAVQFAKLSGRTAAIGSLADIPAMVRGEKGTLINPAYAGLSWHASS